MDRLRSALARLNPGVPAEILEEAALKVTRIESPNLVENNRSFHRMITEGVDVEYRSEDDRTVFDKIRLVDFDYPDNNDWLAVNQFTVIEGDHNRRPDVVVFVNSLPLGLMELKNPTDENATLRGAYNQFQTYKNEIPSLPAYNEVLVISEWKRLSGKEYREGMDLGERFVLAWEAARHLTHPAHHGEHYSREEARYVLGMGALALSLATNTPGLLSKVEEAT